MIHVSEIRDHLSRTETFRGYRSATIAFSGAVGVATACIQTLWLSHPSEHLAAYLALWIGAAAVSLTVIGVDLGLRAAASAVSRRATIKAVEQFFPALIVGAMLTLVVARRAPESAWMLPGLWALVFSLGIFASCRLLPRATSLAGLWYVVGGVLALAWGQGESALSPWFMGVTFGGGQLFTAVILHYVGQQHHESPWE